MKSLLVIGSVFAALSVLMGAFGAHGLKNRLSIEDLAIFETAVRYQMYHALGLLLMGLASFYLTEKLVSTPAYFLIFWTLVIKWVPMGPQNFLGRLPYLMSRGGSI